MPHTGSQHEMGRSFQLHESGESGRRPREEGVSNYEVLILENVLPERFTVGSANSRQL